MIVKIFKTGEGCGEGPVQYILGRNNDRKDAFLMSGEPEQTIQLINSLDYKKKYTSGVLSFEENDITDETLKEISKSFEEAMTKGLEEPPEFLFVIHRDKKGAEVHFVIPSFADGKLWTPYLNDFDFHLKDSFQTITNIDYGLSDANDPDKKRLINNRDLELVDERQEDEIKKITLSTVNKMAKAQIGSMLLDFLDGQGFIEKDIGCEEIAEQIKNIKGIKATKQNDKSITVFTEGGKRFNLKGEIYERDFKNSGRSEENKAEKQQRFRDSIESRRAEAQLTFDKSLGYREKRHREKYRTYQNRLKRRIKKAEKNISVLADNPDIADSDNKYFIAHRANLLEQRNRIEQLEHSKREQQNNRIQKRRNKEIGQNNQDQQVSNRPSIIKYQKTIRRGNIPKTAKPVFYNNDVKRGKPIGYIQEKPNALTGFGFSSMNAAAFNLVKMAEAKGMTDLIFSGNLEYQEKGIEYAIQKGISVKAQNEWQQKIINKFEEIHDRPEDNTTTNRKGRNRDIEKAGQQIDDSDGIKKGQNEKQEERKSRLIKDVAGGLAEGNKQLEDGTSLYKKTGRELTEQQRQSNQEFDNIDRKAGDLRRKFDGHNRTIKQIKSRLVQKVQKQTSDLIKEIAQIAPKTQDEKTQPYKEKAKAEAIRVIKNKEYEDSETYSLKYIANGNIRVMKVDNFTGKPKSLFVIEPKDLL